MKLTNSKYFYYFIILISSVVIAFSIYYQLGGFKDLTVNAFKAVDYAIAGREFKGKYSDQQIKEYYEHAKGLIATGEITGTLCLVDYLDEGLGENEVKYFIGILLVDKITELPPGYTVRRIKSPGVLGVSIDSHPLVRPQKEEVEATIYATAQEYDLRVRDYFLEKHYADDRLEIEGFLQ